MKRILNELEAHIIQESNPDLILNFNMMLISSLNPKIIREEIINLSSYCLISKEWIRVLSSLLKGKRCLEIMSGLGMSSKALQDEKIEIIATDSKEWEFDDGFYWTEVKTMEEVVDNDCIYKANQKFKNWAVFMTIYTCCDKFSEIKVYIF